MELGVAEDIQVDHKLVPVDIADIVEEDTMVAFEGFGLNPAALVD